MIRLANITKRFGATTVLDGVSLAIPKGGFVALLGPSGSGKTTLLRMVAGLEQPDSGELWLDGRPALDVPPGQRGIGFVFQGYALFAHMTVADNIGFGLRVRGQKAEERAGTVNRLLSMMHLEGLGARLPAQLSGGQRQRVALARALAIEPRILLLDEPFGALDRAVREELRTTLKRIHYDTGVTTLFVTHDQDEAVQLADRAVILTHGRLTADLSAPDLMDAAFRNYAPAARNPRG